MTKNWGLNEVDSETREWAVAPITTTNARTARVERSSTRLGYHSGPCVAIEQCGGRRRRVSEPSPNLAELRRVFDTAEALSSDASPEARKARLWQYRFVLSAVRRRESVPSASVPVKPPLAEPAEVAPSPETEGLLAEPVSDDELLDDEALNSAVVEARGLAEEALRSGEGQAQVPFPSHRRVTRAATLFAVIVSAAVLLGPLLIGSLEPVDLAKGKPWRASSSLFPCFPERLECGGARTAIFFHTGEDNEPWLLIDLGAPTSFRSVTVVNRRDDSRDRAVPMVLEVSDDEQTWRQVARRDEKFKVWNPHFDTVSARFVRVKVARRSFLHLEAVRVHP
ncbi:MAG: discoidin domain-containing protein [Myxococcales bacterium]|nr:discoidin domain-containing protein [Myxococcales bacterium]